MGAQPPPLNNQNINIHSENISSFSLYCLALAFVHYRQVYIVHSGLQDESQQLNIKRDDTTKERLELATTLSVLVVVLLPKVSWDIFIFQSVYFFLLQRNYAAEVICLSSQLGLYFLDAHTLLSNEEHPELPDWRETIRQEVAAYIEATGHFREEIPHGHSPNL